MEDRSSYKGIIYWLLTGCFLVYVMVVVGCLTRLTHSGLSITDWNFNLFVPPMSDAAWQDRFAQYQTSPEFKLVNHEMTLQEFKPIFWWEYIHRSIGMFIGVVFMGGFAYFFFKKRLNAYLYKRLFVLVAVGALQGVIGWWMVKSGLSKRPAVGHYELATHLMSAFMVFAFTFWLALDLMNPTRGSNDTEVLKLRKWLFGFFVLLIIQIIYGAFTAGYWEMGPGNLPLYKPGQIFNTWPKMGDQWIADQVTMKGGFFANFFENAAGIQFVHRTLAVVVVLVVAYLWYTSSKLKLNKSQYRGITLLIYGLTFQFTLGVFTLVYHVPVVLGVLHQSGAFFLFAVSIYLLFHFRKSKGTEVTA